MASQKPEVFVFPDLAALSQAAARLFMELALQAVQQRGRFLAALSGGSTPARLYTLLAQAPYAADIPWNDCHFFWGDERCVPPADPQNSYGQAALAFLNKVPVPPENIHRILGETGPAAAAEDYTDCLKKFAEDSLAWPRFDLVLLGLGADGHTASLFPGANPSARWDAAVLPAVADYQGRPAQRVTLTPPVFNSARRILFLVSGADKAAALSTTMGETQDPVNLPAQNIHPEEGEVTWMVDQAAAGDRGQADLA